MSRKSRKGGKRSGVRFVMLDHYILNSPAYRDLEPTARAVYVEIKKRYNGSNNGKIGLGVREAGEAVNRSKSAAQRAFDELRNHGFIQVRTPSTFDQKRMTINWLLTEYRDDTTGRPPLKSFLKWSGGDTGIDGGTAKQKPVPSMISTVPESSGITCQPDNSAPNSPISGPVSRLPKFEQSHSRATYRSAPPGAQPAGDLTGTEASPTSTTKHVRSRHPGVRHSEAEDVSGHRRTSARAIMPLRLPTRLPVLPTAVASDSEMNRAVCESNADGQKPTERSANRPQFGQHAASSNCSTLIAIALEIFPGAVVREP